MHIALFGGAFDPPHLGHQQVTQVLLKQPEIDEVWYVPVKRHPFSKHLSPDRDRVQMLETMLQPGVKIERYELDHDQMSYTWHTLNYLTKKYPEYRFSWVIGSDNLVKFKEWFKAEELLEKFHFYVYPRSESPIEMLAPKMRLLTDSPVIEISSSQVRAAIAARHPWQHLVSPAVAQYIMANHLYDVANS